MFFAKFQRKNYNRDMCSINCLELVTEHGQITGFHHF